MAVVPLPPEGAASQVRGVSLPTAGLGTLFAGLAIVALLYFGRDVFVPLVLAVLLSFVLAPVAVRLRRWGIGRTTSVLATVVTAFLLIAVVAGLMGREVSILAEDLPRYQYTITQKLNSLQGAGSGVVARLTSFMRNVTEELKEQEERAKRGETAAPAEAPREPIQVEIREPDRAPIEFLQQVVTPLLEPLATAGIVVIFVIFILLYRQDLRDRMIRLVGAEDLRRTTDALDDAASRLSRYFLTQTAVNAAFGVVTALFLWAIGIPTAVIWGILAMLMRFVPFVGGFIAAAFPIVLAVAVDPGWTMLVLTVGYFLVAESLMGQVVEPYFFGHSTGLTPIAVLVAATFWTWLWGPIGLLLSTPLTVCLVVLGRHVERLEFLDVLLGDRPALTPEMSFYQRALAGDPNEASEQAELVLKDKPLVRYYDEVVMPALGRAQEDLRRGALNAESQERIRCVVEEVIDNLADADPEEPEGHAPAEPDDSSVDPDEERKEPPPPLPALTPEDLRPEWRGQAPVLCIAGPTPLDEAAGLVLTALLRKHCVGARLEPFEAASSANIMELGTADVRFVCLSFFDAARSPAQARFLVRRLRRRLPDVPLLAGFWGAELDETQLANLRSSTGADLYAATLHEALGQILAAASASTEGKAFRPDIVAETSAA